MYREATAARRRLQRGEELTWTEAGDDVVAFARHDGWRSVTNFGTTPVAMPEGDVVLASGPLDAGDGLLPGETTVWLG